MARESKKLKEQLESIKAEIARLKKTNKEEPKAEEEPYVEPMKITPQKEEIVEKAPKARRETVQPANEVRHVRGQAIKIEPRSVQCKKCNYKFFSDLAQLFESNVKDRVVCVCPSCTTENLIRKRTHLAPPLD